MMTLLERFLGGKSAPITSMMIRADIDRCETEIAALQQKISGSMAGIATMTDADHLAVEADIAASQRAIARLDARIASLTAELPTVNAGEEAAAQVAVNEALRQRAEASRKANTKESAKLLNDYMKLAEPMADILARLDEIRDERNAVNVELRKNPVADAVLSFEDVHRKTPDRPASERREVRPCWVHRYPASPRDTENLKFVPYPASEEVREATIASDGKPLPVGPVLFDNGARLIPVHPTLEDREIPVEKIRERRGTYEEPLTEIRLPPALAGGKWHWPRR